MRPDALASWTTLEPSVPRQSPLVPKSFIDQPIDAHRHTSHLSKLQDILSGDPLQASLLRRDKNAEVDSRMSQAVYLERTSADSGSSIKKACIAVVIEKLCCGIGELYALPLGDF